MLHVVSCCLSLIYYLYQLETNLAFPGVTLCFGLATGLEGHRNHHKMWEVSGIVKNKQLDGRAKKNTKTYPGVPSLPSLPSLLSLSPSPWTLFTFHASLSVAEPEPFAAEIGTSWFWGQRSASHLRTVLEQTKRNGKYDSTVQYAWMSLIPSQSNKLYVYTCMYCQKISQPPQRTVAPSGCCNRACHGSRLPRRVSSATLQVGSQSRVKGGGDLDGIAESCCHAVCGDSVMRYRCWHVCQMMFLAATVSLTFLVCWKIMGRTLTSKNGAKLQYWFLQVDINDVIFQKSLS